MLFNRPDCHLCDDALALAMAIAPQLPIRTVDIESDAALERRYDVRVPVLRDEASGRELGWPFDAATLMAFLGAIE